MVFTLANVPPVVRSILSKILGICVSNGRLSGFHHFKFKRYAALFFIPGLRAYDDLPLQIL